MRTNDAIETHTSFFATLILALATGAGCGDDTTGTSSGGGGGGGGDDATASSTAAEGGAGTGDADSCLFPDGSCTDHTGELTRGTTACGTSGGTLQAGSCPTEGRVGSCFVNTGDLETVERSYAPTTEDEARAACTERGGREFVPG